MLQDFGIQFIENLTAFDFSNRATNSSALLTMSRRGNGGICILVVSITFLLYQSSFAFFASS